MSVIRSSDPLIRAVVVADGEVERPALERATSLPAGMRLVVIGADGGAAKALAAGVRPDIVVGDGDSLDAETAAWIAASDVERRTAERAKDESDAELAVLAAAGLGATQVRIVGALGGSRPEHGVANVLLLAHPALDGLDAAILTAGSTIRRMGTADGPGNLVLEGQPGDLISLLPLDGRVEGVTTSGLRFPLHDEQLEAGPARGLSNELLGRWAQVDTRRGRLLVAQTSVTPEGTP